MRGHVVLSLEHLVEKSCKVSENVLCPAVTVSPVIACVNVHNIMMIAINTVYGKTFEGENFRGCAQNTPFTGKLSRCIRPMPLCTVHSK